MSIGTIVVDGCRRLDAVLPVYQYFISSFFSVSSGLNQEENLSVSDDICQYWFTPLAIYASKARLTGNQCHCYM